MPGNGKRRTGPPRIASMRSPVPGPYPQDMSRAAARLALRQIGLVQQFPKLKPGMIMPGSIAVPAAPRTRTQAIPRRKPRWGYPRALKAVRPRKGTGTSQPSPGAGRGSVSHGARQAPSLPRIAATGTPRATGECRCQGNPARLPGRRPRHC